MTSHQLIRLLSTFPPDAECVIELLDGTTSVPIQGAVQYENSANPRQIHILTSTLRVKELPSITAKNVRGIKTTFRIGDDITCVSDGSHFPGTIIGLYGDDLRILWPDDSESTISPTTCFHG